MTMPVQGKPPGFPKPSVLQDGASSAKGNAAQINELNHLLAGLGDSAKRQKPAGTSFSPARALLFVLRNTLRFGIAGASIGAFEQRVLCSRDTEPFWKTLRQLPCDAWGYGSAFTGRSFRTGQSFDFKGEGTSDIDVILDAAAFKQRIPMYGMKSATYSDKNPFPVEQIEKVRKRLGEISGREVSFQLMTGTYRWLYKVSTLQPLVKLN